MKYLLLLFICIPFLLTAQIGYDQQWLLFNMSKIDFRNNSIQVEKIPRGQYAVNTGTNPVNICDENGNFIMYSGGCYILNKDYQIMPNGDSINSAYSFRGWCSTAGDLPIRQSTTILPHPSQPNEYFVVNFDLQSKVGALHLPFNLLYHRVDMEADNGLGAVVDKYQIALQDTFSAGGLTAIRHANGTDWWVIAPRWLSNCYRVIPITKDGFGEPLPPQCLGIEWPNYHNGQYITASPDGKKYARVGGEMGLHVFDFDATTGLLSNPIRYPNLEGRNNRGICFSPSSRYIYLTASDKVYQYDLTIENVNVAYEVVGEIDLTQLEPWKKDLHFAKLAPNGKIYIGGIGNYRFLSVINRPNCPGISSAFQPHVLEIPFSTSEGLPNLPHFYIPDTDEQCNSVFVDVSEIEPLNIHIFPNPVSSQLFIEGITKGHYQLFDLQGRLIKRGMINRTSMKVDVKNMLTGVYYIYIANQQGQYTIEKIWRK